MDGVIARQRRGQPAVARTHQRSDTRKHAEHVGARRRLVEVEPGGLQHERHLALERPRLEHRGLDRGVGRADDRMSVPRNGEHHPAVLGVRHHDGGVAREKRAVEDQVDTLARRDDRCGCRVRQPPHVVGERTSGVDDDARRGMDGFAALQIPRHDPINRAVGGPRQRGHRRVIEQRRALLDRRLDEIDQQPGVVELAVVVDDAAAQTVRPDCRQPPQRLLARQDRRVAEAVLTGEHVVDLQPDAVERRLPPVVVGNHERQVGDQVRRIAAQHAALLERLHHQRDVALLEITDAAVHQLGAAARRPLAEVALLEQQRRIPARGGVDGDAHPGGAAADDDEVPGALVAAPALEHPGPGEQARLAHASRPAAIQPRERPTASRHRSRRRSASVRAIDGSKRRSTRHCPEISAGDFQKPTASPAR